MIWLRIYNFPLTTWLLGYLASREKYDPAFEAAKADALRALEP